MVHAGYTKSNWLEMDLIMQFLMFLHFLHSLLYVVTCFPLSQQYPLSPRGPSDATLTSYTVPRLRLVMVYEVVLEPDTERVV